MTSRLITAFRIIAFVEAVSWLGLLIGMYFKYIAETGEVGVKIFGPIHGAIFVAYVVLALLVSRRQRWPFIWTAFLALLASIPPFATIWFEIWAARTGRFTIADAASTEPVTVNAK